METKRTNQLEFGWQTGPTVAVARRTDPETSREAGRSVNMRRSQAQVLWLFRQPWVIPGRPRYTDEDLLVKAEELGVKQSPSGIRSRRCELVRMGYLRDSGLHWPLPSGRKAILWERTEKALAGEKLAGEL